MSDVHEPGSADERPLVGARFRHQPAPREKPSRPEARSGGFTVVVRGYHRHEVDDRIEELDEELDRLRSELCAARERLDEYRAEVERLRHAALRAQRDERGVEEPGTGRGPIADKIIRSAQREALLIRANAQKEAARIRAAAQADPAAEVTTEVVVPRPRSGP